MGQFLLVFEEAIEYEEDDDTIWMIRTPVVVQANCGEEAGAIGVQIAEIIGVNLAEVHPIGFQAPEPEPEPEPEPVESDQWAGKTTEELLERIEHNRELMSRMVGNLYPSVLAKENESITEALARRHGP